MAAAASLSGDQSSDLDHRFVRLARQTVEYAKIADCRLVAFSGPDLPHFSSLGDLEKRRVVHSLQTFNDICAQVLAEGKSLSDSRSLTWYALRHLNFVFSSDLFSYIENDNIVEIYDRDNIQIFRNFNFFNVVSYTLEDLLCRPWTDLFARVNQEHTLSILNTCKKFYSKEVTTVTSLKDVGIHRIEEYDSPFSFKVDAVVNFLAPIYDKTRYPAGFIAIETATLASKIPELQEAQRLLEAYEHRSENIRRPSLS